MSVVTCIQTEKIIPVARGIGIDDALRLAAALLAGGIHLMELPLAQSDLRAQAQTLETVRQLRQAFGQDMYFGCGTVLTAAQAQQAAHAGAQMIISPDVCPSVIAATRHMELVSIPGAITPTEIAQAQRLGADFVKLFPIQFYGPAYIKALRAPLDHVNIIAMGGVDADNLQSYLQAGCCAVGIGHAIVDPQWIAAGQFDRITQAAASLCAIAVHSKQPEVDRC